jgi:hypothetical protein
MRLLRHSTGSSFVQVLGILSMIVALRPLAMHIPVLATSPKVSPDSIMVSAKLMVS